jgi:hypothetical protein
MPVVISKTSKKGGMSRMRLKGFVFLFVLFMASLVSQATLRAKREIVAGLEQPLVIDEQEKLVGVVIEAPDDP